MRRAPRGGTSGSAADRRVRPAWRHPAWLLSIGELLRLLSRRTLATPHQAIQIVGQLDLGAGQPFALVVGQVGQCVPQCPDARNLDHRADVGTAHRTPGQADGPLIQARLRLVAPIDVRDDLTGARGRLWPAGLGSVNRRNLRPAPSARTSAHEPKSATTTCRVLASATHSHPPRSARHAAGLPGVLPAMTRGLTGSDIIEACKTF